RGLELHADPGQQVRVPRPGRQAEHGYLAAVGLPQALHDLERGGLARPVGAKDPEELPRGHLDADAVHATERAVHLAQAANDGRFRHWERLSPGLGGFTRADETFN